MSTMPVVARVTANGDVLLAGSLIKAGGLARTDTTQSDWQQGTLSGVVATAAGDLELAKGLLLSDGSTLSGWTAVGVTVDAGFGNPAPALWARGGQYAYKDVGLKPGDTIEFDVYIIRSGTALCNFYFLCDANGAGQMFRLDARGGPYCSGFASTSSWTQWDGPSSGFYASAGVWYHVKLVIDRSTVEAIVDGVSRGTFAFTNRGGYIAVHGDKAGVTGGYFDNIVLTNRYVQSGSRTSPSLDLSPVGIAAGSSISWNATTPAGTSVTVGTRLSLDGGATWQGWLRATNGGPVPGITAGMSLNNVRLQTRVTLSTQDTTQTPRMHDLTVWVAGARNSIQLTATGDLIVADVAKGSSVYVNRYGVLIYKGQLVERAVL